MPTTLSTASLVVRQQRANSTVIRLSLPLSITAATNTIPDANPVVKVFPVFSDTPSADTVTQVIRAVHSSAESLSLKANLLVDSTVVANYELSKRIHNEAQATRLNTMNNLITTQAIDHRTQAMNNSLH